jgi:hypothetical protein
MLGAQAKIRQSFGIADHAKHHGGAFAAPNAVPLTHCRNPAVAVVGGVRNHQRSLF